EVLARRAALLVRVVQARRGRGDDRDDVLERYHLAALADLRDELADVLAVDVLHREEVRAVLFADVVDLDDVVVMERRRDARFLEEGRDELLLARELAADALDHDVAREALEPGRTCEMHVRDIARRELFQD